MDRVVLEEVDEVVQIHEGVVDGHDLGGVGVSGGPEGESSDSAESVDTESSD